VGGRAAIIGKVMGPWTMSYHMAGTQNFLLAVGMGETAKVNKMLRQLMPLTIAFINAQFAAGADVVVLADHATRNLVGPYHYEQYLLPIHQEITSQVGGPIILHVCGTVRTGWSSLPGRVWTPTTSSGRWTPRRRCGRIGDQVSLVGNVNNPQTLLQGTPEDVYKQARYAIEAGVHLIGPECAIRSARRSRP